MGIGKSRNGGENYAGYAAEKQVHFDRRERETSSWAEHRGGREAIQKRRSGQVFSDIGPRQTPPADHESTVEPIITNESMYPNTTAKMTQMP
jgi:hypothetical protein